MDGDDHYVTASFVSWPSSSPEEASVDNSRPAEDADCVVRSVRKGKRAYSDVTRTNTQSDQQASEHDSVMSLSGMSFKPMNIEQWRCMPIKKRWLNPEWRCHEWLSMQFVTHTMCIARDPLSLRFFLLNHLSFRHATSWWNITTLLESSLSKSTPDFAARYRHLSEQQREICRLPFHELWRSISRVNDHSRYEPNVSVFLSWHVDDTTWLNDCRSLTPRHGAFARIGLFESASSKLFRHCDSTVEKTCVGMLLVGFVLMTHYDSMIFDESSLEKSALAWCVWQSMAQFIKVSGKPLSSQHIPRDVVDFATRQSNWLMCIVLVWKACRLRTRPGPTSGTYLSHLDICASADDINVFVASDMFHGGSMGYKFLNWLYALLRMLINRLSSLNASFTFRIDETKLPVDHNTTADDYASFVKMVLEFITSLAETHWN